METFSDLSLSHIKRAIDKLKKATTMKKNDGRNEMTHLLVVVLIEYEQESATMTRH